MSSDSRRPLALLYLRRLTLLLHRRVVLGSGSNVQTPVDDGRDRLDLGSEFLFDPVQVEPIFVRDEVDRESQVSVSTGSSDSVKVGFGVFREVKVDDDVDGLDIDTTSEEIYSERANGSV